MSTSLAVARPESQLAANGCPHCHDGLLVELQAEKIRGLLHQLEHAERAPQPGHAARGRLDEPTLHHASFMPRGKDGTLFTNEAVQAALVADGREATLDVAIGQAQRHPHLAIELAHGGWLIEVTRLALLQDYNHRVVFERSGRALARVLSRRNQCVRRTTPRGVLLIGSGDNAGFDLRMPWSARRATSSLILQVSYRAEAQTSRFVSEALRGVGLRRVPS